VADDNKQRFNVDTKLET